MADEIHRLAASDHGELVTFLADAFGDTLSFDRVLPGIYQPTERWMRCNLAIRRGGRIAAVVGVFPIELRIGPSTLRVAGIGGVAVAPAHRRQGLMRRLMDRALRQIREESYDISFLGGQRQRYRYWGWEKCGTWVQMSVGPPNVRHEPEPAEAAAPRLEPVEPAALASIQDRLLELHDAQVVHCRREPASFARFLQPRDARTFLARGPGGQIAGYLVVDAQRANVHELVGAGASLALSMVREAVAVLGEGRGWLRLGCLCSQPASVVSGLARMAESVELANSGNWQVFDWPAVCGALLRRERVLRPLVPGSVVIGIAGQSRRLCLRVAPGGVDACWTSDAADLSADAATVMRLLFGPLCPSRVLDLPPAATLLSAWCPLPLALPRLDWV